METIRKVSNISVLIYFLYGIISWINLGEFIPPFPLFPLIVVVFIVAFIFKQQKKDSFYYLHLLFLLTFLFIDTRLIESFLNYNIISFFNHNIIPYVRYLNLLLILSLGINYFLRLGIGKKQQSAIIILIILIFLLQIFIHLYLKESILLFTVLIFAIRRLHKVSEDNFEGIQVQLNTLSLMILMDILTLQLV